jgi:hypothetical protein
MMKNFEKADYVWTVSEGAKKRLIEYGYKGDVKVIRKRHRYDRAGKTAGINRQNRRAVRA